MTQIGHTFQLSELQEQQTTSTVFTLFWKTLEIRAVTLQGRTTATPICVHLRQANGTT